MSMNSKCGCGTVCRTPKKCIPIAKPRPPSGSVTIEGLLELIDTKCDKETCLILQFEIDILYAMLQLEKPDPEKPPVVKPPKPGKPLPDLAFQLVSNMVESLKGDLKDKYPSAELLKAELQKLWKCMNDKHTHHGEWNNNFTMRTVVQETDDKCLLDGETDPAPEKIKVITPVDVGSTVFHTIGGKRCLFESLVDNNTSVPGRLTVLQNKWLSYCDLKDVINCVLPRKIITDCHDACDDPDKDGVKVLPTLCEQIAALTARVVALGRHHTPA